MHDLREELWLASRQFDNRDARTEANTIIDRLVPSNFPVGYTAGFSSHTKEDFRDVVRCLCRSGTIYFDGVDPMELDFRSMYRTYPWSLDSRASRFDIA
jgi:hypothetical protein